jgi:nucleotide sugar dehydrogenase
MDSTAPTACVVGLGKIGLPLAVQYATRGFNVVGADLNPAIVEAVNQGQVPHTGETDLDVRLADAVSSGRLQATTDTASAVRRSQVVVVVVPLVVDQQGVPDFRALDSATSQIAKGLAPGTLVLYETTVPVGTTRRRFVPALEAESTQRCGTTLFVAFSPERVYVGRVFQDLRRYPKLVGGIDEPSAARATEFYEQALEFDERPDLPRANGVWDLGSAEAAELAKLAETTYRDVNIGLANEFAKFSESAGIDVFKVIEASNSQPFSHIHQPGIAVGGHCIPVYPRLFLTNAPDSLIPAAARTANLSMPYHCVDRLSKSLDGLVGKTVAILGLTYRGGVKETAFSGAFPLVEAIREAGGVPLIHDPLFTAAELGELGFGSYEMGATCDAAIIQADHREYATLAPADLPGIKIILDGRHLTDSSTWRSHGVIHLQVGVAD